MGLDGRAGVPVDKVLNRNGVGKLEHVSLGFFVVTVRVVLE